MVNEPSEGIDWADSYNRLILQPAVVDSVYPESIGQELGLQSGDRLLSINGKCARDLIDVRILTGNENLTLVIESTDNCLHLIEVEKDPDEGLGIGFTEALFDGLKQCNNKCPFCFIDQQPSGYRETLYLKDDDFRLSFLYGSYLTLTNLVVSDWERIESQRLSPLYISIHATDPELRSQLLHNKRAGLICNQLRWFSDRRLQIHTQVVVCPGFNDGPVLQRTLIELAYFAERDSPTILSVAIVPVGLTHFRPDDDKLISSDKLCAENVIDQVEYLQCSFSQKLGSRFAWLSDEWFLIAKRPLPPVSTYENFSQQENGVGTIRSFLQDLDLHTRMLPKALQHHASYSWVVGQLVMESLEPIVHRINRVKGLQMFLYGLPSLYWGQEQVVTGLLTGSDLLIGLQKENLGDTVLLPSVLLQQNQPIFLDDIELSFLQEIFPVKIEIVYGAMDLIRNLC
ncbi:MAG TPA: TIGR03279 family radical SAM protein [Prochlorococcaceae cyanobacterium AMR_MDS_5431]|nr:TIGR03279 family radical SAM protein [Prochlorococcaceae cyanobacterium AMR_MDS_5431]